MDSVKFKTEKGSFIAVLLPADAVDVKLETFPVLVNCLTWDLAMKPISVVGDLQLIGPCKDLTEEQWMDIIPKWMDADGQSGYLHIGIYNTAKQAGQSLLADNHIYMINPYGDHPAVKITARSGGKEFYRKKWLSWKQAEAKTGNWILIKQI